MVHEAAHAQDYANVIWKGNSSPFSNTSAWGSAVRASSCRTTAYSASSMSDKEEYAEVMLAYVYDRYSGSPALDDGCIQPELDALTDYSESLANTSRAQGS